MSEILLTNQPIKSIHLQHFGDINPEHIHGAACTAPSALAAFTPYLLGPSLRPADKQVISALSAPKVASELTQFSLSFGADNTLALAGLMQKLSQENVTGLMGASTSVYANRMGGFAKAVGEYQDALLDYRAKVKSKSVAKAAAKNRAHQAFKTLQLRFRNELNAMNASVRSSRGTPLSNPTRATNIARSSRSVAKLKVTSQVQANNLVKFTQHVKYLGNGLAVIDFGTRIGNVHNAYHSGENWERELFIESSSFAFSAGTGMVAVNVGTAALGLLVTATPVGWLGLIIGGIAVAGGATAVSVGVNSYLRENSGGIYDNIMDWIGSW